MFDSIVITIDDNLLKLPEVIEYQGIVVFKKGKGWNNESTVLNYNQVLKKRGLYGPSFEILRSKRKDRNNQYQESYKLKIQFSAPKLIYGTNLLEIQPQNLPKILQEIKRHLEALNILTTKETLLKAIVERVDFSKTMLLPSWIGPANKVIKQLFNLDYKQRSDFRLNCFGNDSNGVYISFYNTAQKFTIYDKISEIEANGFTKIEKGIIEQVKKGKRERNALRFELSLEKKQTMEAVLKRYIGPKKKDFTLNDIMNLDLSRNTLLEVFNNIYSKEIVLLVGLSEKRNAVLESILDKSKIRLEKKVLLIYLVNKLWEIGEKDLWKEIQNNYKKNKYYEIRKEISKLVKTIQNTDFNKSNIIEYTRQELEKFELIIPKA